MIETQGLGEAVKYISHLSREAAGAIITGVIESPTDSPGLPRHVPVAFRSGAAPEVASLRKLLEEWRTAPARKTGYARVDTLRSFIELTARHQDANSAIFSRSEWPAPSLTAVIDYHELHSEAAPGGARFGEHRVVYQFPVTEAFTAWAAADGKEIGQAAFAEWVEEHIADMSVALDVEKAEFEPRHRTQFAVPTELIELARGLEIHVNSRVKNIVRLQSGEVEMAFETEHKTASGHPVTIPGLFMLSLPLFVDGGEARIACRLNYRVKEGATFWRFQMIRWRDAVRARVAADKAIAGAATGLPVYEGAPEGTRP